MSDDNDSESDEDKSKSKSINHSVSPWWRGSALHLFTLGNGGKLIEYYGSSKRRKS